MVRKEVGNIGIGLLGWKSSGNSDFPYTIDEENSATTVGRYFEDFSALIRHANIYLSHDNPSITEEAYNTYLRDLVRNSTRELLNKVFTDEDFLENHILYDYEFDFNYPIDNVDGRFVGYEFDLVKRKDVAVIVNNVDLTFETDGQITLELYHSSRRAPLLTKEIEVVAGDTVKVDLDWVLPHTSSAVSGGRFYIGYRQADDTPRGYDRIFELGDIQNYYHTCYVYPVEVPQETAGQIFDVHPLVESERSWGLSFDISAYKDYTDIILTNKRKFVEGIGLQVAVNILDQMDKSTRLNGTERVNAFDVTAALNGIADVKNGVRTEGLLEQLSKEIDSLRENFVPELKMWDAQIM